MPGPQNVEAGTEGKTLSVFELFLIVVPYTLSLWVRRTVPKVRSNENIKCHEKAH